MKSTRNALIVSILSIFMCATMLVSSTFAWFTDTATTSVNKIQAGKLDVGIEMYVNNKWTDAEKVLTFQKYDTASNTIISGNVDYFVPGEMYILPALRITNLEEIAFKYRLVINGVEGNMKLAKVLDVYLRIEDENNEFNEFNEKPIGTLEEVLQKPSLVEEAVLVAENQQEEATTINDATGKTVYQGYTPGYQIALKLKDNIDNGYQGLSISGMTFTVYATQTSYDYTETYSSGTHIINKDLYASKPGAVALMVSGTGENTTTVTIEGGTINGGSGGNNVAVWADEGSVVNIKDGTFTVGADAQSNGNSVIYTTGGTINISGGFFYTDTAYNSFYYVLNVKNGSGGDINVTGGTFVNFDPLTGDDTQNPPNFVEEGYIVTETVQDNGDIWYTVSKSE